LRDCALSDAGDGFVLVAVGLLEGEEHIDLRPVREHLPNHRRLVAILLSKLANVAAFVVECTEGLVGLVLGLVAIGSAAASTGEASSTAAAGASAARSGRP
jgi:hypothetical protein